LPAGLVGVALMSGTLLHRLILAAGVGQLALVAASLAIPRVLRWREETAKLRPLSRQVFWTYAGYIWVTNLCFGLVSAFGAGWLLEGTPLAAAVTGYMAAYWVARLVVQFAVLDRSDAPSGAAVRLAEAALVTLFVFLAVVYVWALAANLGWAG
jgi:hypothetical protein